MADLMAIIGRARTLAQVQGGLLDGADEEQAVREALSRYSQDAPRQVVVDLIGDGSTSAFSLPSPFDSASSIVLAVEFPAGRRPAEYLPPGDWVLYRAPSGVQLRLERATPGAGEVVRVTFTAGHTVDGLDGATETTVPVAHEEALVTLVAARLLFRLAARFLHDREPVLADAVIDRQSRAMDALRLASELESRYREQIQSLAAAAGTVPAAGTVVEWDVPGSIVLTHWGRTS
mgnify:CR=1 FL=1